MRKKCEGGKHQFRLVGSTFGADQGAMCVACWTEAPYVVYKALKLRDLEHQADVLRNGK